MCNMTTRESMTSIRHHRKKSEKSDDFVRPNKISERYVAGVDVLSTASTINAAREEKHNSRVTRRRIRIASHLVTLVAVLHEMVLR